MQKKLKIVIFDGSFQTTTFIRRLIKGLVSQGHQVYVLGFNLYNPSPVESVHYESLGSNQDKLELLTKSLALQGLGALKNLFNFDKKKLQAKNLAKVLKKINPDVIHAQWNSVLPWLEPYLEHKTYPIILSQRGYHTNIRPFINTKNYAYLQRIYPKLSGLHSVSEAISENGKKVGEAFTRIDKVVHTGLDLKKFPVLTSYRKKNRLELISVGRAHWIKDYSMAIRACAILKKENINFHYIIVGAAGNEELIYLINFFRLNSFISLTEKLPFEEVQKKVFSASLSLITSIKEGIPNVAVEAMALGTPVISTDCGGMEELITHQQEGWIIPRRNPQALADQIQAFVRLSESEIEQIRQAARQKVEREFNEEQMVVGMEQLYKKVLNAYKQYT
ncbi:MULTISPECIES: glycosyltransferase family 4 protein [Mesonia]|uniref:Teichuronic acid biosynthesis glycosyltransferase TuaC n=1 Tax=Mesonia oceanica TaxID=2687242 RepID=A0AC61Y9Y1_9FLAO|nr:MULTISPECIES: glycosyltransferase family 4 protein [Mesonia]MAN26651.1 colanic acid biosynthesis protein [Mesonia sp.]MAQ40072.1 colanic acid biosynthesis protein [Mesonia sp.]MBJ96626.1 colanic acid biosynthesis protein [Flavobacteriaceae bacterium]VVV01319.1 Putative teichuronic acid biosynthesis glycosyltransferase TuaC [Mesonia oceanica]|tara:strand:- start:29578 stop:30750 length:1173 start_codon:yes stop_codon:yes gene_type:complete